MTIDQPSTEEQYSQVSGRRRQSQIAVFHQLTTVKPGYQNPATSDKEREPLDVVEEAYYVVLYILVITVTLEIQA